MKLWKVARATRRAARAQSAARNPAAFARRRATSKALGALGVWRALNRLWR